MPDKLVLFAAPTVEPVSRAEAKAQLRVDFDDDDDLIDALIVAAREAAELIARRAFVNQTWDLYLDALPDGSRLDLPKPPLVSVTGVYYTPEGLAEATLSTTNYAVDNRGEPGGVVLKSGQSWPAATLEVVNGVRVRFVAGYGTAAANVPERYRQAIKLLVGHLYENREDVVVGQGLTIDTLPQGALWLLGFDRFFRFPK